ncbi:outer membrane protein with beta-barrel domain [Pontibacter mucosus]|uniref:Outer membrane protein with beta-barrel domain n=1 Tax=Pontibacter mucosus TaxID=1649266 RepID=A0A2T5YGP5_9BACT|nr:autotransporter domain-containing protein [Pontibacter mucosus]PTX18464.1 outer membrane protein with beta-barrel domain [Pontibacter mucosus]
MKRLWLTVLLACIGSAALAQTSQGSIVASGSLNYQHNTSKSDAVTHRTGNRSFTLAPSIGYMLRDGLEAGMSIGYTSSIDESKVYSVLPDGSLQLYSTSETTDRSFAIGPYLKKYFYISEKIAFTGQAYVNYVSADHESHSESTSGSSGSSNSEWTGFSAGVKPGITFFPTTKIGLSAGFGNLGYTRNTSKSKLEFFDDYKSTSSNFGLDLSGNSLTFGFSYYISR